MSSSVTNHDYMKMIRSIVVPEILSDEEKGKQYLPLIDYLKLNTPVKLYRFRSCKERTFHEFDKNILGFAPAFEMNDDFDGLLYFDKELIKARLYNTVTPENIINILDSYSQGHIPAELKQYLPEPIIQQSIETFSRAKPDELRSFIDQFIAFITVSCDQRAAFLSQLTQSQKIACLSRDVESAAMWGYYANNSTGFALSYDLRGISFAEHCLVPVIYGEKRLEATEFATWLLQQQILQCYLIQHGALALYPQLQHAIPCPDQFMSSKALIHKSSKWRHEKEWRLIYYDKGGQNQKYPYVIKKPTAVYLGRHISAINEKILRQIAAEKGIPVYKMTVRENNPSYKLVPQRIDLL